MPVDVPSADVKAATTLSALSSQPINTLLPELPLSKIRPRSFGLAPVNPALSSINESLIDVFVELSVVALPEILIFPVTVKSPVVTSSNTNTLFLKEPVTVAI